MFGFVKGLFTSDTVTKTVDGIYNGVDKLILTDEERLDYENKKIEYKLKSLPLFEPYKLAQRYIAVMFTINFILAFWVGVALLFMEKLELLEKYLLLVGVFNLGWIMLAIIGWYFTNGALNGILKPKDKTSN